MRNQKESSCYTTHSAVVSVDNIHSLDVILVGIVENNGTPNLSRWYMVHFFHSCKHEGVQMPVGTLYLEAPDAPR
jgi:hypothetical protein